MPFKKINSPTTQTYRGSTFVVRPGPPQDWNFLVFTRIDPPFEYQWVYGLAIFFASVVSVLLFISLGDGSKFGGLVVLLFVLGLLIGFPLSIYWIKKEIDWRIEERESSDTYKEPRIIEEITLVDDSMNPDDRSYASIIFVYHHFKKGKYIGTVIWNEIPRMSERFYSVDGSSELYVTCSSCNTRSKCVAIGEYHPNAVYWLDPHDNCSKFPHHPKYDVEAIFRHRPIRGNTQRISRLRYFGKERLDFQKEIDSRYPP